MYCPKCNKNVYTKKNEFNVGLAIFLAIFTGGIGLLIYVAVYLDREHHPKCIHCNSVCYEPMEDHQAIASYQVMSGSNQVQNQQLVLETYKNQEKSKFCYNCGSELDPNEKAKFCALCGSSI
ncbi:MAG: hypothetical protein ACFFCE_01340 [Promethearchaeota archaeon]